MWRGVAPLAMASYLQPHRLSHGIASLWMVENHPSNRTIFFSQHSTRHVFSFHGVQGLALGRGRIDGASARDHEARTGGCFEPEGGIHQWPDGCLDEPFHPKQCCQFLAWTSTI